MLQELLLKHFVPERSIPNFAYILKQLLLHSDFTWPIMNQVPGLLLVLLTHAHADIDECATNTSMCDQNCTDTSGSFICDCNVGYELINGTKCVGK